MPYITTACNGTPFLVVVRYLDAVQNALSSNNLIGTHDQQQVLSREHTVTGNNVQDGMLAEEGLGEVNHVRNDAVVGISPERGKLEGVAGLFLFDLLRICILDVVEAGGVGVVLGICAVGDNENLYILEQTTGCPETISLIAVDLVECLTDGHATALQLDVDEGQTINQNGHIITVVMLSTIGGRYRILIDNLQMVVVNVFLVNKNNVFTGAIVPSQDLHVVFLNELRLLNDARIGIGQDLTKEAVPFAIGEGVAV